MAGLSTKMELAVVNALFGGSNLTALTDIYIGLCTSNPGDNAATAVAAELSGGNYARQGTTPSDWTTSENNPAKAELNAVQSFDMTGVTGATITHATLWKTSSATGDLDYIGSAAATVSVSFSTGDTVKIEAGNFDFEVG